MKHFAALILLLMHFACSTKPTVPDNFDQEAWQSDPRGCKGVRAQVMERFFPNKSALIGLSENEVLALMGKPDRQQLYQRNQKFYFYNLDKGPLCGDSSHVANEIYLRMSATFQVTEVNYRQD